MHAHLACGRYTWWTIPHKARLEHVATGERGTLVARTPRHRFTVRWDRIGAHGAVIAPGDVALTNTNTEA